MIEINKVVPQVNQIEINPFYQRINDVKALKAEGIAVEAWAPFAEGKNNIFSNPILTEIGNKYGKSVAQVIINWLVSQNIIVLSKTTNPERMKENLDIFDFELSTQDLDKISNLDEESSQFFYHEDPEHIKQMANWKI